MSQEAYINKVLERFNMKDYSPSVALIIKSDRFKFRKCQQNDFEREHMKNISYALIVESLMYAQVCTTTDIAYLVDKWKAAKKVMRYLHGTNNFMVMYKQNDNLEVIGYPI